MRLFRYLIGLLFVTGDRDVISLTLEEKEKRDAFLMLFPF